MKNHFILFILLVSTISWAQQVDYVDFKNAQVEVAPDTITSSISAKVVYEFLILKNVDSVYLDAQNINIKDVLLDNKSIEYNYNSKRLTVKNSFKTSEKHTLSVKYQEQPKKALYFVGWNNEAPNQIWTQGQGKYTSNWLPSLDDTNDKIEFDLNITFNKDYQVIANGKLLEKEVIGNLATWRYNMQRPMSSYLVALAIGKYDKKTEYSKTSIPLEMYYYPEDSAKVESTYRYTKQIFDFLEDEIGMPYPWQNYKQVPVFDFLYGGMENTTSTIFSDAYVVDNMTFIDKNYVNVNAHELAHQWFGDLVTAKSGEHHWLQEGFATYYALLAEGEVFGEDYFYSRLDDYAQELLQQDKVGQSTSLLNPKSSSLTFYKKGAWVLHMLKAKIGEEAFKKAVKNYLQKHLFKNVETNDFISEVEKASGMDLNDFVQDWLVSKKLHYDLMMKNLKKESDFIKISEDVDCETSKLKCKELIQNSNNNYLKIRLLKKINTNDVSKEMFTISNIKFRQVLAQKFIEIPLELKSEYESLLNDPSYLTIEIALYNLWNNFPENRKAYLDKTQNIVGLNNKNVRMLWIVLALSTPNYKPEQLPNFYNELVDYTSEKYGFETRLKAFQYLLMIKACNDICKQNLQKASKHHNWRLAKFAKEQLELFNQNQE